MRWIRANAEIWLKSARFPFAAAALAVLLSSPSLQLGYVLDDKVHQAMLRPGLGFPEPVDPIWGLFAFMDGNPARNRAFMDAGIFPWWTEPKLRAQFLRPVTALTHLFDHRVAPDRPMFAHAHSLAWLAACVLVAGWVFRSLLGATAGAGLATLMFAVEDAHGIPAAWLANRNGLIALVFGLSAIALHDLGQRRHAAWARVGGPLCLLAGLLSAEAAVGAVAYLFAYAVFLPTPVWRVGHSARIARALSLLPHAVVVVVWKALHGAGGFGAWGSGLYLDPAREPVAYAAAALVRIPILLVAQWTPIPSEVAMVLSVPMRIALAALGAGVVLGLMGWTWRRSAGGPASASVAASSKGPLSSASVEPAPSEGSAPSAYEGAGRAVRADGAASADEGVVPSDGAASADEGVVPPDGAATAPEGRAVVGCFLLGSVLAAVPVAAVFPSNRVLVFVGVGVFGAVGHVVASWLSGYVRVGRAEQALLVGLVVVHLPFAAVGSVLATPAVDYLGNGLPGRCANAVPADEALEDTTLVFINAHALCAAYVLPSRALEGATRPAHVRVLGSLFSAMEIVRSGPRSLSVRVPDGYHHHPMDRLMRRGEPAMPIGSVVRLSGFEARVEGHNAQGRVDHVRFTFDLPLDDPRLRFFVLDAVGAKAFAVPAVGDTVYVPAVL